MTDIKVSNTDPITACAEAVKEIASVIAIIFNGENRKLLLDVKNAKRMKKALDIAEEIFMLTNDKFKDDKEYMKLIKKFNKCD